MGIKSIVLRHKFLYELYFIISRKKINRKRLDKEILKLQFIQKKKDNSIKGLIVSLTSYGERLIDLKYTLLSLVRQSICPEKIIVWLGYGEIIPADLRKFEKYNVEFKFCEDIRSYTKLIPAKMEFPNACIVTADDDIYYAKNWLKKLWVCHTQNPDKKIAHIAHEICFNNEKRLLPYTSWNHNIKRNINGNNCFPTGVGGILYPSHQVPEVFFNKKVIMKLCPNADDVWFFFMGLESNIETVIVPHPYNKLKYVDIYKEYGLNDKFTLQSVNVEQNLNDVQMKAVMDYFNISDDVFYNLCKK